LLECNSQVPCPESASDTFRYLALYKPIAYLLNKSLGLLLFNLPGQWEDNEQPVVVVVDAGCHGNCCWSYWRKLRVTAEQHSVRLRWRSQLGWHVL